MKKKLIGIIKRTDMFGQQIQLNFKGKNSYQTAIGGCASLMTLILFISLFSSQLIDLFQYENFKIRIEEQIQLNPPLEVIGASNFIFAVRIQDSETIGNQKFFDLKLVQRNQTTQKIEKPIPLIKCTVEHFSNINGYNQTKEFIRLNIGDYYCPPLDVQIYLQGVYGSEIFSYLKLSVQPCSENCVDSDTLNQYLVENNFFKIDLITSYYQINPQVKDTVKQYLSNDIYFTFVPGTVYTRSDLFLRQSNVLDDYSLLPMTSQIVSSELFQIYYEDIRSYQIFGSQEKIYGEIFLRMSPKSTIIKKSYQKLDEYMAYVGGLLKFGLVVVGFFVANYNKYRLCVKLANKLYNFDLADIEARKKKQTSKLHYKAMKQKIVTKMNSIKKRLSRSYHPSAIPAVINNESIFKQRESILGNLNQSEKDNSQHDLIENKQVAITFDRYSFLRFSFNELVSCKKTIKMKVKYVIYRLTNRSCFQKHADIQLIDKSVKLIRQNLDINMMIDKMQQIDKLKQILLDPQQTILFDYVPKPLIQLAKSGKLKRESPFNMLRSAILQSQNFDNLVSLNQLYQSYASLIEKQDVDQGTKQVNDKLFFLLGDEIKEIFEFSLALPTQSVILKNLLISEPDQIQKEDHLRSEPSLERLGKHYDENSANLAYEFPKIKKVIRILPPPI